MRIGNGQDNAAVEKIQNPLTTEITENPDKLSGAQRSQRNNNQYFTSVFSEKTPCPLWLKTRYQLER